MTVPNLSAPDPQRAPVTVGALWRLWAAMVVFGGANFIVFFIGASYGALEITAGLVYLAVVVALVALAYFGLRWRYIALGLLAGYILMTLCSAGVCTLLNTGGSGEGAFGGLLIYPLALLIFFVALIIASIVAANRTQ